jgi:hypothetical protein
MLSFSAFRVPHLALTKWAAGVFRLDFRAFSPFLARLSPREQRMLGAAGVVAGGLLLYLCALGPLWEFYDRLHTQVAAKERELSEVVALSRTYRILRQEVDKVRPLTSATLSPIAFLENLASGTVGRDKVAAINPAGNDSRAGADQAMLELSLTGVFLRELVELLYKIDTASMPLRITRLSIKKRYKDPYTFDVTLTTVAINTR